MTLRNFIELGVDHAVNNFDQLASLYKKEYGEALCSACVKQNRQNAVEAFKKVQRRMKRPKCDYPMKAGILIDIPLHRSSEALPYGMWNKDNVTTEVAVKLINAGYGNRFIGDPISVIIKPGTVSLEQLSFDELSLIALKHGIGHDKINESTKEELIAEILLS